MAAEPTTTASVEIDVEQGRGAGRLHWRVRLTAEAFRGGSYDFPAQLDGETVGKALDAAAEAFEKSVAQ